MPVLRADVLYGLLYLPTDRLIVKSLAIFSATFPDTYGWVVGHNLNIQRTHGNEIPRI